MDTNKVESKKRQFKALVTAAQATTEQMFKVADLGAVIEEKEQYEYYDEWLEEMRMDFENRYLDIVRTLFEIDDSKERCWLPEDWFWLEWEATDNCFYFMLGRTEEARFDSYLKRTEKERLEKQLKELETKK